MALRKKKPSKIQLNIVETTFTKRKKLSVNKVSIPAVTYSQEDAWSRPSIDDHDPEDLAEDGLHYDDQVSFNDNHGVSEAATSSSYHDRQRRLIETWESVRKDILWTYISTLSFPLNQLCIICSQHEALIYCKDCSYHGYFCESCATKFHQRVNRHHNLLYWIVSIHNVMYTVIVIYLVARAYYMFTMCCACSIARPLYMYYMVRRFNREHLQIESFKLSIIMTLRGEGGFWV